MTDPASPASLSSLDDPAEMLRTQRRTLAAFPADPGLWGNLAVAFWAGGWHRAAARALARADAAGYPAAARLPARSVVIPVLDYSPGSPWDIVSLLGDLEGFDGEVICVFNSPQVFDDLKDHPRIDKFAFNKHNAGVARSWNIGINQAEGEVIFVLNADLHVTLDALAELERHVLTLPRALMVGIGGEVLDLTTMRGTHGYAAGEFDRPVVVDKPSGYAFALHARRLHQAGLAFDPRFSPYFYEETDIVLKARAAGYEVYAAPVRGIEHVLGISASLRPVSMFGREVDRIRVLIRNANLLLDRAGAGR